jgi:isochorismate synthase EntC
MFPEAPTLGEAFMNDNEGFELRNFNNTKNATANQQFQNAQAAIHNYGALYSSMWKTVWDQAKANNNQKDIEKIFLSHLVLLDFRETFITALDAIKIVIADEFPNGNYTQLFENEWNRRGL